MDNKLESPVLNTKKWYYSKTLWVNAITIVATLIATYTGHQLPPDIAIQVIAGINIVLRIITKEQIV